MQVLQVQLEIGADPAEVGRARRWARHRLAGFGIGTDEPLAETLLLLVSELVTNAVVHTGAPAVLRMLLPERLAPGPVRVEVVDLSSRAPRQRHADGEDTNGRGLELVSGLADRWGWQREGTGKRIWCELDRVDRGPGEGGGDPAARDHVADQAHPGDQEHAAAQDHAVAQPLPAVQLVGGTGGAASRVMGGGGVGKGVFRA